MSRPQSRQYGLYGNRARSPAPSGSSSSAATESASAAASCSFSGSGVAGLGAVPGQHRLDRVARGDGRQHGVPVVAGLVALGLGDLLHVDAHGVQRVAERLLEVLGPGVVAALGVRHLRERPADVLAPRRVDADGDLAEPVVVVPHVQVPGREAAAPELLGHEVHGEELAQVAEVHPPRRAGARGDGDDRRRPSPACRTASSAARVTQSCGSPSPAEAPLDTGANATGARPVSTPRARPATSGAARVRRSRRRRCTRTPRRTPTPSSRAGR